MFIIVKTYVLVIFSGLTESKHFACGLNQYTIKINDNISCVDCPKCPVGYGSIPQCGKFLYKRAIAHCRECRRGLFYSASHGESACMPCTKCLRNQIILKTCTPQSDTVCGECKPGFYPSYYHSCEKCARCCGDDEQIEPKCITQGLERNMSCRYTGRICDSPTNLLTLKGLPTLTRIPSGELQSILLVHATAKTKTLLVNNSIFIWSLSSGVAFLLLVITLTCILVMWKRKKQRNTRTEEKDFVERNEVTAIL